GTAVERRSWQMEPRSKPRSLREYIISEELARCQFGAVHRCVEIATKKTFMAKFIKVRGTDRELVLREIEALNVDGKPLQFGPKVVVI
uniref:Protein kinase domain-containing protein n=1 Tax=Lates calcarifer TaxID=8187 RepID=A0A4W6E219_LATCA